MRKDFPPDAPPETLLAALEDRVLAAPALAAEWAQAWSEWPAAEADARVRERFREWFLLERESPALGMPPAAAWAPRELGERDEDPWTRLLEAQFRVLRVDEGDAPGTAELTDLWSGMRFEEVPLPDDVGAARLLLGRIAPSGVQGGRLLAGWRSLADDVIADALAGDLARVRAEQPRARLSQRECEALLAPHLAAASAAAVEASDEERLQRLAELLRGAPGWTLARAVAVLEEGGAPALLERVAFESDLPLEPLRRLLSEWTAAQVAAQLRAPAHVAVDAPLRQEAVVQALAAYDRARAEGSSLDQAWQDLQDALDLPDVAPIADEELWTASAEVEPIGPGALPGLGFWMETWAWEREQAGRPAGEAERAAAAEFAQFVERLREGELDAAELSARDLWNFYATSADAVQLARRQHALADLIAWLRAEQGAFVAGDPQDWTAADRARLAASVELNARLRAQAVPIAVTTRLAAVEPARVATDHGDWVEVVGLGARGAPMRPGDLVAGSWSAGSFRAAAWLPQPATGEEAGAEA
jgi:hypothetical protein